MASAAGCRSVGMSLVALAGLVLGAMHLQLALPVVIIVAFYHGIKTCTLPEADQSQHHPYTWPAPCKSDRAALLRRLSSDKLLAAACHSSTTEMTTQARPCASSSPSTTSSSSCCCELAVPAAGPGASTASSSLLSPALHSATYQPAAHSGLATLAYSGSSDATARQLLRTPSRIPSPPSTPVRRAGPTRIPRPPTPASPAAAASLHSPKHLTTGPAVSEQSGISSSSPCRHSCQPGRGPAAAATTARAAPVQRTKRPAPTCTSQPPPAAPKAVWSLARPHTQRRTTTLAQACTAASKAAVPATATSSHSPRASLGARILAPATPTARCFARSQTLPAGRCDPSPTLRRTASVACKPWGASQAGSRLLMPVSQQVQQQQQQQRRRRSRCPGNLDASIVMWTNTLHCTESAVPCNYEEQV